jgi:hypothetical protein
MYSNKRFTGREQRLQVKKGRSRWFVARTEL